MANDDSPIYDLAQDRPSARIGIYFTPIFAVFAMVGLLIWGVTEWTAWKFGFHPNLGPPIFEASSFTRFLLIAVSAASLVAALLSPWVAPLRRVDATLALSSCAAYVAANYPLYPPWEVFVWGYRFGSSPGAEPIFTNAWHAIAWPSHAVFLVGMYVAWRRAKMNAERTDAHGSARWANRKEILASGLLDSEGVFLGVYRQRANDAGHFLRHDGPEHVLGFAPTRSGKGVGWVIPTLLTWRESAVVHDIKGENWARTAGFRSKHLGNRCLRFDPTSSEGSSARYNPILEVRRGDHEVRDAQNIAEMLVDPDGDGGQDHWDVTAAELLVAAILHVLYVGRDKSLRGCLDLLTSPHDRIENILSRMMTAEHDPAGSGGWIDRATEQETRTHPVVAGAARSLLNKSENERSAVVSSAVKCLSLFRDEIVTRNTAASDFAIGDLIEFKEPVTLYLIVPPSDASRARILVRLLINQIGKRLTENLPPDDPNAAKRRRVLMMMDEFPTLGRLDFFQSQLAYLAGYGIKAFLIVQDLSQLYAAYTTNESIVSNCHIRLSYAPNKVETARLLSEMAGIMTVQKARRMYSGNRLAPWLSHVMESEEESQRPLVTPDEVLRLPDENAVIFVAGRRPILALKARYYEHPALNARSRLPPPSLVDRIPHDWGRWRHVAVPNEGSVGDPNVACRDVAHEIESDPQGGELESVLDEAPNDEEFRAIG